MLHIWAVENAAATCALCINEGVQLVGRDGEITLEVESEFTEPHSGQVTVRWHGFKEVVTLLTILADQPPDGGVDILLATQVLGSRDLSQQDTWQVRVGPGGRSTLLGYVAILGDDDGERVKDLDDSRWVICYGCWVESVAPDVGQDLALP